MTHKQVKLALFSSLVIAVGGPSSIAAAANTQMTMASGNDVVLPDGTIYQVDGNGSYHWIPDVATGNAMHLDWNGLQTVGELPGPEAGAYASVTPS